MLQKETGLCVNPETPLIGIVSRLVAQKGMDLIDRMIAELLEMDLQLIVLGTGERKYEDMFLWARVLSAAKCRQIYDMIRYWHKKFMPAVICF